MNSVIAAVVVTFNRKQMLEQCLAALERSTERPDVIVIDNASSDGTGEMMIPLANDRDIYYFNTGVNIGGAGGFNYGLRKAYEMGYEYFWLMDDDTIVGEDSLSELLHAAETVGGVFGFLSSQVLWTDGSECEMNKQRLLSGMDVSKKYLPEGIAAADMATFVSFFTRRAVIEQVGLPIKEYFIWGDDIEYSLRISDRFSSYVVGKSQVVHKMASNLSGKDYFKMAEPERLERYRYQFRNQVCTYRRRGAKTIIKFLFLTQRRRICRLLRTDNPYKWRISRYFIRGSIEGFFFNPKIEYVKSRSP